MILGSPPTVAPHRSEEVGIRVSIEATTEYSQLCNAILSEVTTNGKAEKQGRIDRLRNIPPPIHVRYASVWRIVTESGINNLPEMQREKDTSAETARIMNLQIRLMRTALDTAATQLGRVIRLNM